MKSDAPMQRRLWLALGEIPGHGRPGKSLAGKGSEAHVFSRAGPTFRTVTWYHEYPNWQDFYTQITMGHAKDLFLGKMKRS